jgi:hypothetical protein
VIAFNTTHLVSSVEGISFTADIKDNSFLFHSLTSHTKYLPAMPRIVLSVYSFEAINL